AMGLPVVATDIPGNVELVEHEKNGLLVSPEDPVSVASAVERFVNDTALRERLAANARRYAEDNLDQDKVVPRLESYCRRWQEKDEDY
ncbi:MAG: glycosyltransferase, partial [bacterium]